MAAPAKEADKAATQNNNAVKTTDPTNTGKNARDQKLDKPTAQDQSTEKSAEAVTIKIRKAIMAKKGMSVNGQNVKIIVENGAVTLRGPVDSDAEKQVINKLAKKHSGKLKLTNELEVKENAPKATSSK